MNATEYLRKKTKLSTNPWVRIITEAESYESFSPKDIEQSCQWATCPVGLLTQDPTDVQHFLGKEFYKAVNSHQFFKAARLLVQINS